MRSLLPILVLALTVATGAEAQAYARGPLPAYGVRDHAATEATPPAHAEPAHKSRKRPASMTLPYSFFADAGGVGGVPQGEPTYAFYGMTYAHAQGGAFAQASASASAYAASHAQVRIDSCACPR